MHGYSKTPLARKLGIKDGFSIMLVNQPKHYFSLFSDFPKNVVLAKNPETESLDFIHLFCNTISSLENQALSLKSFLKKTGMLWVSWPKGTSKIATDIHREAVRDYMLLNVGLVDIKVAAIDKDWSGLKFVYRTKDR